MEVEVEAMIYELGIARIKEQGKQTSKHNRSKFARSIMHNKALDVCGMQIMR
jgi:hypothetical protein